MIHDGHTATSKKSGVFMAVAAVILIVLICVFTLELVKRLRAVKVTQTSAEVVQSEKVFTPVVYRDPATGCYYLSSGNGLIPRVSKLGTHICVEVK